MKPFLKWAGGKYQIIERIKKILPEGKRLIEPFVGAGSVFLNTNYSRYLLADNNADLIKTFKILKKERQGFIDYCAPFFDLKQNTEKAFFRNRELFNKTDDLRLKAALFIYLNKHAFNGLMRFNSSGKFNVSFGRYKKPYFPAKEMLHFANRLRKASIKHSDFTSIMEQAVVGDVVYCDPPYLPLSQTANFMKYTPNGFGLQEQKSLVRMAKKLAKGGITVIISNHDTEFVHTAYQGAKILSFDVQRYISFNAQ